MSLIECIRVSDSQVQAAFGFPLSQVKFCLLNNPWYRGDIQRVVLDINALNRIPSFTAISSEAKGLELTGLEILEKECIKQLAIRFIPDNNSSYKRRLIGNKIYDTLTDETKYIRLLIIAIALTATNAASVTYPENLQ